MLHSLLRLGVQVSKAGRGRGFVEGRTCRVTVMPFLSYPRCPFTSCWLELHVWLCRLYYFWVGEAGCACSNDDSWCCNDDGSGNIVRHLPSEPYGTQPIPEVGYSECW